MSPGVCQSQGWVLALHWVQRDGWLAELEHQQGEERKKQTLLEILLCARQFWGLFFLQFFGRWEQEALSTQLLLR